MQGSHDLKLIFDAGIPLIAINNFDEPRVLQLPQRITNATNKPLFQWTSTDNLRRANI